MKLASVMVFAVLVALLALSTTLATAQSPQSTFTISAVTPASQAIPFSIDFFGAQFQVTGGSFNITIKFSGIKLHASAFATTHINEYDSHDWNVTSQSKEFAFVDDSTIVMQQVTFPARSYPSRNFRFSLQGLVAATVLTKPINAEVVIQSKGFADQVISYQHTIFDDVVAFGGVKVTLTPRGSRYIDYEDFEFTLSGMNQELDSKVNDIRLFDQSPLEQGVFTVINEYKPLICFINGKEILVGFDSWTRVNTYLPLPRTVFTIVKAENWVIRCPNIGLVRHPNPTPNQQLKQEVLADLNSPCGAKSVAAIQQIIQRNLTSSASLNVVGEKKSPLYLGMQAALSNGQLLSSDIYIERK